MQCDLSGLTDKLVVSPDPGLYYFINQGCLGVDNMDDAEEMKLTDVSPWDPCPSTLPRE